MDSNYEQMTKKVFYVTAVIVVACVIASGVIAHMTTEPHKIRTADTEYTTESEQMYVLTSQGDRIVAFVKGAERPFIETNSSVSSLPKDVQARIRAGIEYSSEQELRDAINEYCS